MHEAVIQRWGQAMSQKYQSWQRLVFAGGGISEMERLVRVNDFFNRQIAFGEDVAVWGQTDYWATPMETLGRGSGDCEDFAIAKLFTLRLAGVPPQKLRLVYVQARTATADGMYIAAHMVLAYYAQPDAEPLVLDNLIPEIRPASRRADLAPVFSFNDDGVFKGAKASGDLKIGGVNRLSRWEDLIKRVHAEGLD